jgi:hypothetical protein
LDGGSGFDVEHGVEAERIREVDVSARNAIAIAREEKIAG